MGSGAAEVTQSAADVLQASLGQAGFRYFPLNPPEVACGHKEVISPVYVFKTVWVAWWYAGPSCLFSSCF